MKDNEENLNDNIKKYNNIIKRYKDGEFGKKHLSLKEILLAANEPNLLNEMTISEVQYLYNHSSGILKTMFSAIEKEKLIEESKITLKDYLEDIINILNTSTEKEYMLSCFSYPIVYEIPKDSTIDYETRLEGVIAITTKNFDIKDIKQGYLCSPEKYSEFYEKGEFILCFGPAEKLLNFDQILQEEISDIDIYESFYGFPEISKKKILEYKGLK